MKSYLTFKVNDLLYLFSVFKNQIYVYNLKHLENLEKDLKIKKLTPYNLILFQELEVQNIIYSLIEVADKLYLLEENGILQEILYLNTENDSGENDLFDSSDEMSLNNNWQLKKVANIFTKDESKILNIYVSDNENTIIILLNKSSKLYVNFIKLNENQTDCWPIEIFDDPVETGCLLNIPHSKMDSYFYLTRLQDTKFSSDLDHIFVGLSNGLLLYIQNIDSITPKYIYRSSTPIIALHWFNDISSKKFTALRLVTNSGTIIALTMFNENVTFLPILNIKFVNIENDFIYVCNTHEFYRADITEIAENKIIIPLREVSAYAKIQNFSHLILLQTKLNHNYAINVASKNFKHDSASPLPSSEMLQDLLTKTKYLTELNEKIKLEEYFHQAVSLAKRFSIFEKQLNMSIKIVQIAGSLHTIQLKISIKFPGIIFMKDIWKILICSTTSDKKLSLCLDLPNNFSMTEPLIILFRLDLENCIDLKIDSKFISISSTVESTLAIQIGQVVLDASYFLQPVSSLSNHQEINDLSSLFSNWLKSNKAEIYNEENNKELYSLTVPITCKNEILKKLLENSKALWRVTEWNSLFNETEDGDKINKSTIHLGYFGREIILTFDETSVNVKCSNFEICCALKSAILNQIRINEEFKIDVHLIMQIEAIHQTLDTYKYETDQKIHNLIEIYNNLRKNVTSKLT